MVEGIEETPRDGYDYNSGTQDPNASEAERKYDMMKKTLWTDGSNGKFIGLDHVVALGDNGETVTAYYR